MVYREWPNPGLGRAGISKEDLMKPAAYKAIFWGLAIQACHKPELIEIFKLTFGD
jgi:hypothetical protein